MTNTEILLLTIAGLGTLAAFGAALDNLLRSRRHTRVPMFSVDLAKLEEGK